MWLWGLLGVAGCRPAPLGRVMHNDFESLDGWSEPQEWLTTAVAHSGRYAVLLAPKAEYAATYQTTWEGLEQPRRLRMRAWARLPHARTRVALVLQVMRGPEKLFW